MVTQKRFVPCFFFPGEMPPMIKRGINPADVVNLLERTRTRARKQVMMQKLLTGRMRLI
jgi:hypothetical protein